MGRDAGQALFQAADNFAAMAQAFAQNTPGIEQHPLFQVGMTPEQLGTVANLLHTFGHMASQYPEADSLGVLSDRVNAKQGEYPLKIVVEASPEGDETGPEYLLEDMKEMGRLARLPALLATEEQKATFLSHPLVQQGLPSFVFVNVADNSQTFEENAAFADITRGLIEDEPDVFGSREMREAMQGTMTPPFGMPTPPPPPQAKSETDEGPEQ